MEWWLLLGLACLSIAWQAWRDITVDGRLRDLEGRAEELLLHQEETVDRVRHLTPDWVSPDQNTIVQEDSFHAF